MHDTKHDTLQAIADQCRLYFENAKDFLSAKSQMPDPTSVIRMRYANSSLESLKLGADTAGPYVQGYIQHTPTADRPFPTQPHLYDPWWIVIMRYIELAPKARAGRHYRLNAVPLAEKTYYYVNYSLGEFPVRRLIMNTPERRATPDRQNYHDNRKIALRTARDTAHVAVTGFDMNTPFRDREHFIALLAADLRKQLSLASNLPGLDLSQEDYLRQLAEWFTLADQMFAQVYGTPIGD
jgi:hypothetical protein